MSDHRNIVCFVWATVQNPKKKKNYDKRLKRIIKIDGFILFQTINLNCFRSKYQVGIIQPESATEINSDLMKYNKTNS